jgi:hypothetical protein
MLCTTFLRNLCSRPTGESGLYHTTGSLYPADPCRYSFISELEAARVLLQVLRDAMYVVVVHPRLGLFLDTLTDYISRALDVERTCRIWSYWFHGFNAIVSFAATVIRSPTSSLAHAILVHIEDGVALFERVPSGYTPHQDLVSRPSA